MEENTTALSAQNQDNLSENSTQEMLELAGDNKISEFPDYSTMNLKDIIQAFQDMLDRADQQELYKNADAMKAAFYKMLKREKVAAGVFEETGRLLAMKFCMKKDLDKKNAIMYGIGHGGIRFLRLQRGGGLLVHGPVQIDH